MTEFDEELLGLITKLSQIGIATVEAKQEESCPICTIKVHLEDFPVHVYKCCDAQDHEEQNVALQQFSPPSICSFGSNCQRRDRQHFLLLYHPTVKCFICSNELQMYQMDEHFNICLNAGNQNQNQNVDSQDNREIKNQNDHKDKNKDNKDRLTRDQLIAISTILANKIHKDKNNDNNNRDEIQMDDEPSLTDLLTTFSKLGFTRENIEKEITKFL